MKIHFNFQKAENDAINIDVSVIPIGTYILKVISQNSTSIKKVVIARWKSDRMLEWLKKIFDGNDTNENIYKIQISERRR